MPFFRGNPELLRAFRAGQRDALEQVYWATVKRIEQIVRHGFWAASSGKRVPGVSAADVGDVVQEVFARAFRESARNSYDGVREFTPYLSTIARNTLIDWARRRGLDLEELVEDVGVPGEEVPLAWADEAAMRVVESYLATVPAELRLVHEQRYVLGRSQNEASRALGTTRQKLRTAEGKLRDGLHRALRRAGIHEL